MINIPYSAGTVVSRAGTMASYPGTFPAAAAGYPPGATPYYVTFPAEDSDGEHTNDGRQSGRR